jgi:UDPglucose 6-dehydrogenase
MLVSVIGAGYVGLTTAACLAEIGHEVCCADSDFGKLQLLRSGRIPFYEPMLAQLIAINRAAGRLRFTSTEEAILHSEAIFICVGTPPLENGEADLSSIANVCCAIARTANGYRLVIEKSTVPVQTARNLRRALHLYSSSAFEYDVVSNPEFLCEGSAVRDFLHPDRIVVGTESPAAAEIMKEIYDPLLRRNFICPIHGQCPLRSPTPLLVMDTSSAELVKHASNSFLAMKISFINLVADLCEAAGAQIDQVAEGIGLDPRIGKEFLRPGIGFGGFCFPKDLQAFVRIAEKLGCDFTLLKEVERINLRRVEHFLEKLRNELWVLRGKQIGVWGLAFKPNSDDIRFAPALSIVRALLAEGAQVSAYDPQAMEKAKQEIPQVTYCDNLYDVANDADAILLLTEWDEFKLVDWARLRRLMSQPVLLDGRNLFSPETVISHGFRYLGVGRKVLVAETAAVSA